MCRKCTVLYGTLCGTNVPQSTAKRVKKFGPESIVDYRKVMAAMLIQKADVVPKKRFCQNAPQNPAFKKVR